MANLILYESEVNEEPSILREAWQNLTTFAFVPDKSGVSSDWIADALHRLPPHLKTAHFALLTSGSTGHPKLVVGCRRRAEKLALVLDKVQESDLVAETIVVLPLTYCYAFINQWLWAFQTGKKIIFTRGFSAADEMAKSILSSSDGMLCLIGAQIPLFAQYFPNASFPGILRLHFAGGTFPINRLPEIRDLFPNATVFNNYGCAEAMPRLSVCRLVGNETEIDIGTPLPGVELSTIDSELLFRSPYASVAYVDGNDCHEVENESWVSTGDIAEVNEKGNWRIVGRKNEVYKRYGEKIALPHLLTSVLKQWFGQAAFYRFKDREGEDAHVLLLSPEPTEMQLRSILQVFRSNHSRAHWPLRIESVRALPVLSNGKIDLIAIKELNDTKIHWRQRV